MRLVFSIGINDKKGFSATKEYRLWADMLKRCSSKKYHELQPSYIDCSVSENFKSFSYFYDWCQDQIGFGVKGWQLDKDILVKGNRVYSEDNCVFIPYKINGLLERCYRSRGDLPIGVHFDNTCRKFRALVRKNNGQESIGLYDNPIDAFSAYKHEKELHIKNIANSYKFEIDPRAYDALMGYTVDITD